MNEAQCSSLNHPNFKPQLENANHNSLINFHCKDQRSALDSVHIHKKEAFVGQETFILYKMRLLPPQMTTMTIVTVSDIEEGYKATLVQRGWVKQ